jgi:hypothetical protein
MLSAIRPYSELLPLVCDKLVNAAALLPAANKRLVSRIGVVSRTSVEESNFPPGITRLLEHYGKPWAGNLDEYNINVAARLNSSPDWVDRCIHLISKPADPANVPTLNFDWQRTFGTARHLNERALADQIASAREAALRYFEELALGSMFDEGGTDTSLS